jgi:transposase
MRGTPGAGRPAIAPEKLLRTMLLRVHFNVCSERQLMEQIQYNMLYRWFMGLAMDDEICVPKVIAKNRERLIELNEVVAFLSGVVAIAKWKKWLSREHFSVECTLILAWASHKSYVPKDGGDASYGYSGNPGDFRG